MRPKLIDRVPAAWRATLLKWGFNLYPSYRATGGRVVHISRDLDRIKVVLPYSWKTRNPAGALFGGSLYAFTDPMFAMLLALQLGNDVIVWDKAGSIRYKRPGRSHLFADFHIPVERVEAIRREVLEKGESTPTFCIELKDRHGVAHVELEKTVYVATKAFYKSKLAARAQADGDDLSLPPPEVLEQLDRADAAPPQPPSPRARRRAA